MPLPPVFRTLPGTLLAGLVIASAACTAAESQSGPRPALQSPGPAPTPEEARAFVARVNEGLRPLMIRQQTAEWIKNTYITVDTERNAAAANAALLDFASRAIKDSRRFDGLSLDPETQRMLHLIQVFAGVSLPAPTDPAKRD